LEVSIVCNDGGSAGLPPTLATFDMGQFWFASLAQAGMADWDVGRRTATLHRRSRGLDRREVSERISRLLLRRLPVALARQCVAALLGLLPGHPLLEGFQNLASPGWRMVRFRIAGARRDAYPTFSSIKVEFRNSNRDGIAASERGSALACWVGRASRALPMQGHTLSFLCDGVHRRQLLRVVG
jgi:hypothetical protein